MKRRTIYAILLFLLITLVALPFSGCITITSDQPTSSGAGDTTTAVLPVIQSFTVSSNSVKAGAQVELSWNVTDATTVTISPGIGFVDVSGTATINPAQTTTYTLSAENSAGTETSSVTINIVEDVARADLVVTDVFLLADSLYFKVINIGNEESKGNRAFLYINDVYTSDTYTNPLKPGEEKTIVFNKFTWPYQIEKEQIYSPTQQFIQYATKVCVDTNNDVPENDETNNCYTIIMGSKVSYNFVEKAHLAPWANEKGLLTFPSPAGNSMGSVFTEASTSTEDGRAHSNILATYPQPVTGGYISGKYSYFYNEPVTRVEKSAALVIPPMSHFTAGVGFTKTAAPNAMAKFTFSVIDETGTSVYSREIIASNDGQLDNFDEDLSSLGGQKRHIILRVESMGEPGGDLAIWIDPLLSQ
jgi:hypothetical protein